MSDSAANSQFVTYEWVYAALKDKAIVPVLIDPCDLHPKLEMLHHIRFDNPLHKPWNQLVRHLNEIVSKYEAPDSGQIENQDCLEEPVDKAKRRRAERKITSYLDEKGFQIVSFERIKKSIDARYDEKFMRTLARGSDRRFRLVYLKPKDGSKTRRLGLRRL